MNRLLVALLGVALSLASVINSYALDIRTWQRMPIAVPLVVGHERVVFIDRDVRVGVPASIGSRLRVQSAGGALYLLAHDIIEPTRLQLQDTDDGTVILIDIAAEAGEAPLEPIRIVDGTSDYWDDDAPDRSALSPTPIRPSPLPVVLTRYAAQSLYAPLRTVEPVPGLARVRVPTDMPLDTLLPTLPIRVKALAAWRLDDIWVTAVRLTNTADRWLSLDPRAIQGHVMAATFQHSDLAPAGDARDTTVLYLVTRGHGLAEALLPAISPIDAALNLPAAAASGDGEGAPRAQ